MIRTYNELYMELRRQLKDAGAEACSLEAQLLLACAAGKSRTQLLRDLRLYSSPEIEERLAALARRRLSGEPAAYILGKWEFYGLEFTITPEVLIPRPDTETLVDKALELAGKRSSALRILDLCTGSGCVGCALARQLPQSHVVRADLSRAALNGAKQNARDCGLGARAVCVEADALSEPAPQLGFFDLIVCNPPYVARPELPSLDVSVREYEPIAALDGGADGLDFYRSITPRWKSVLQPGGWLLYEVGETQADDVTHIMAQNGFTDLGTARDSAGYRRVVYGRLLQEKMQQEEKTEKTEKDK